MQSATIYCSHCGAGNRANATYCFSCGQVVHVGTPPSPAGTGRIPPQQMLKQRYKIVTLVGTRWYGGRL